MKKHNRPYHHGNLAESLLDAVDHIASQFGLEAVTLRGCAKHVGVAPSSAFRHYADKRALLTVFATRAIDQLVARLADAKYRADLEETDPFTEVSLAYIGFAIEKPAFFRAMWREETIYSRDEHYLNATNRLSGTLNSGFAGALDDHDPNSLSAQELLAWSAVHGLAGLFIDGPVGNHLDDSDKLTLAEEMISALKPAYRGSGQDKTLNS